MSRPYFVDLDLNDNQLLDARLHNSTAATPPTATNGQRIGKVFYATDSKAPYFHNDTVWMPMVYFFHLPTESTPVATDFLLISDSTGNVLSKITYANLLPTAATDEKVAAISGATPGWLGSTGTDGVLQATTNGGIGFTYASSVTKLKMHISNLTDDTASVTTASLIAFANTGGETKSTTVSKIISLVPGLSLGTEFAKAATITTNVLEFDSQTQNTFLGAPNASAGLPTFRALVYNDLPATILNGWSRTLSAIDWAGASAPYTLTIGNASGATILHGLGNGQRFFSRIIQGAAAPFQEAVVDYTVNDGLIVFTASEKLVGWILISRFG